jgi:hypothetical protein
MVMRSPNRFPLKELMDKKSFQQNEKILTMATDIYNNALRVEEIKEYIEENIAVPEGLDSDAVLCNIANTMQDKELDEGRMFVPDELEKEVKIEMSNFRIEALRL